MPSFLYTAKGRDGAPITERITAPNAAAARYALETRGCSDICFETGDMQADIDKVIGAKPLPPEWTPAMELESRRLGSVWLFLWFAWKMNAVLWIPLAIWDTASLLKGPPYRTSAWIGFALTLIFLGHFLIKVMPGIAFQMLIWASAWAKWGEVHQWVRRIRFLKRFLALPIPEFELDVRSGYALAAEGRLAEGLELLKRHEHDPAISAGIYLNRLASLYAPAKDYRKMAEIRALSIEKGSGNAGEIIDYACVLARYLRDAAGARRVLERLENLETSGMEAAYVSYCRGVIAVEERKFAEAKTLLLEALQKIQPNDNQVALTGFIAVTNAYLAIALAHLGESAEAVNHFRKAHAYLIAHRTTELIERFQEVSGMLVEHPNSR